MDTRKIERISKALADQTRLRIFEAISARGELTCGELVTLRGVTPATISHHLKILANAKLIECRKDGQFVHSYTVPSTISEYSRALAQIAAKGDSRSGKRRTARAKTGKSGRKVAELVLNITKAASH